MPNHVINEIVFRGVNAAEQVAMLIMLRNPKNEIDFDILVPMPRNIWRGNVGLRHEKAFGRENTALEWCRQNWGTKWNAYGGHQIEQTDDTLTLRFQTAWNPPYPWLVAVFNFFRRDFEHNWMSEGGASGNGKWNHKGIESDDISIEAWAETEPEDGSTEYRHLHKLLWGVEEFGTGPYCPKRDQGARSKGASYDR